MTQNTNHNPITTEQSMLASELKAQAFHIDSDISLATQGNVLLNALVSELTNDQKIRFKVQQIGNDIHKLTASFPLSYFTFKSVTTITPHKDTLTEISVSFRDEKLDLSDSRFDFFNSSAATLMGSEAMFHWLLSQSE